MAAKMAGIKGEPEVIYPEKKRYSLLDLILQETVLKFLDPEGELFPQFLFLYTNPRAAVP